MGAQTVNDVEGYRTLSEEWTWKGAPTGVQEFGTFRSLLHGSWDISKGPRRLWWAAGSQGNAKSDKPWW